MEHKKCIACNNAVAEKSNNLREIAKNTKRVDREAGYRFSGGHIHFTCAETQVNTALDRATENMDLQADEEIEEAYRVSKKWVAELPIPPFPVCTFEELREVAKEHYEAHVGTSRTKQEAKKEYLMMNKYANAYDEDEDAFDMYEEDEFPVKESRDEFLDRISVNFLRHEISPYEVYMQEARWRIGGHEAQKIIRSRILDAIAEAYPWLGDACDRQRGHIV